MLLKKTVKGDFVVIDSLFPQKEPFAFRNAEINEYINKIVGFKSYTMYPMVPPIDAPFDHIYGMDEKTFEQNKQGYLRYYPENEHAIQYLTPKNRYKFRLVYSFFLAETYALLPFLEKNKNPFIFVLYPGGLFSLTSQESDGMLKKIFASRFFRGVIVTQQITRKHLLDNKLCREDQINYIYGGFVQFKKDELKPKKYYKKNKKTFDICFVAAKYSERGADKGYDLFIETAKLLAKENDDIRFHVVGDFTENDIDVSDIKSKIKFYGICRPDFLLEFYRSMDIFLAPNRPFKLYEGNFDGFPLGIDAGYCGVALFVADELKMNVHYKDKKDIVIIPLDAHLIAKKINEYYKNIDKFYTLLKNCQHTTQQLFDIDHQITERMNVFGRYVELETVELNKELK